MADARRRGSRGPADLPAPGGSSPHAAPCRGGTLEYGPYFTWLKSYYCVCDRKGETEVYEQAFTL